jgi:Uma2 family endonuclease
MGDAQPILGESLELDLSHIQTEDGEPVDNIFSEKQMRLLTESLYASWRDEQGQSKLFSAFANVGLFYALHQSPLVPDVMVALDVVARPDPSDKKTLSYFLWEFGKPPDIVIEIVSNREGGEDTTKMKLYAQIGVAYYAIYDPDCKLSKRPLRVFERNANAYVEFLDPSWLPRLGLGLCLWEGHYEHHQAIWLRWVDTQKKMLLTGAEGLEVARDAENKAKVGAKLAEEAAKQSEEAAKQSEAAAKQSEAAAKQSEAAAKQSEAAAKQSEAAAKQSEERARQAQENEQRALERERKAREMAKQAEEREIRVRQEAQLALERAEALAQRLRELGLEP